MRANIEIDLHLREAVVNDISTLATHHYKMFNEIWKKKGKSLSKGKLEKVKQAYVKKLEEQFADKTCKAWVIKIKNKIVASGAITICNFVPTPIDLSYKIAYFHSLYTEEKFRNNNCANLIIEKAIFHCKSKGMQRIILTASDEGRPIYQKYGFKPASDLMRLIVEENR